LFYCLGLVGLISRKLTDYWGLLSGVSILLHALSHRFAACIGHFSDIFRCRPCFPAEGNFAVVSARTRHASALSTAAEKIRHNHESWNVRKRYKRLCDSKWLDSNLSMTIMGQDAGGFGKTFQDVVWSGLTEDVVRALYATSGGTVTNKSIEARNY